MGCGGSKPKVDNSATPLARSANPAAPSSAQPQTQRQQAEDKQVIGSASTIATLLQQHLENFYHFNSDLDRAKMLHSFAEDVLIFFTAAVDRHPGFKQNIINETTPPPNEVDKTTREAHLQHLLDMCSDLGGLISRQQAQWHFQTLDAFGEPTPGSTVIIFPAFMKGAVQVRAPDTVTV